MIEKLLIYKIKLFDHSAQKEVYHILLPYFVSICNRYLYDTSYRQDVLQDAFINIFTKVEQFDSKRGSFKSWATKILINKCFLYMNKSKSRNETSLSFSEYQIPITPKIFSRLTNEEILNILRKMPRDLFDVFNLFVVDGFNHIEIAEILSIKPELSRKRLSRAREWINNKEHIKAMIS